METKSFVLVHGGMFPHMSGAIWDQVTEKLRTQEHKVFCPTLTPSETSSFNDHVEVVRKVIVDNNLDQVIMAGHSYGGLVITGAWNKLQDKVSCLVYFDTSHPENGKSLQQIMESYSPGSFAGLKVPALKPHTDPVIFDQAKWEKVPKIYVNCKRSEHFVDVCGRGAFIVVIKTCRQNNWDYYVLDSGHMCMTERPEETAAILLKIK